MSLAPGTRLGPYEIAGPLGAGGMGEVYRARDTRLGRDVAIKVLPDDVSKDSKALARFESEARELLLAREDERLIDYESMGDEALLSVPTPDHYLPLLYVVGARQGEDSVAFPVEGIDGGSILMLSVLLGSRP